MRMAGLAQKYCAGGGFFVKCILIQAQNSHRQLAGHEEKEADKMGEYKFINEELKIGAAS
jgi:hypothetical protein